MADESDVDERPIADQSEVDERSREYLRQLRQLQGKDDGVDLEEIIEKIGMEGKGVGEEPWRDPVHRAVDGWRAFRKALPGYLPYLQMGAAAGGAAVVALLLRRSGSIRRIRTNASLPKGSVASHESLPGIVARVEDKNIIRVVHRPAARSIFSRIRVEDVDVDKNTLKLRLAAIESHSLGRTEEMLPLGKRVNVQLVEPSSQDEDAVTAIVWEPYTVFGPSINRKMLSKGYARVATLDVRVFDEHFSRKRAQYRRSEWIARAFRRGDWDKQTKPGIVWGLARGIRVVLGYFWNLVKKTRSASSAQLPPPKDGS